MFDESSPPSLNRAITLISPYIPWPYWKGTRNGVARWARAASEVPYSEEVCQSVVNTLLWIPDDDLRRSYIPAEMWAWLKRRPSLPPACHRRSNGFSGPTFRHVRGLGDIEILKSYLLLILSEWNPLYDDGFTEMRASIREDFGGVGMWCHRDDLIKHLDRIQGQLDQGLEYFEHHNPRINEDEIQLRKGQYRHLRKVVLEVDKRAMETLTGRLPRLILSDNMLILVLRVPPDLRLCSASPVPMISPQGSRSHLGFVPASALPHFFFTISSIHGIIHRSYPVPLFHPLRTIVQSGLDAPSVAATVFMNISGLCFFPYPIMTSPYRQNEQISFPRTHDQPLARCLVAVLRSFTPMFLGPHNWFFFSRKKYMIKSSNDALRCSRRDT